MNPMIPYLSGWLIGALLGEGKECMKIEKVEPTGLDGFTISFLSGTILNVRVSTHYEPEEDKP